MPDQEKAPPFSLYMKYDFLPVQQQSIILNSIAGSFNAIIKSSTLIDWRSWPYYGYGFPPKPFPPLCITTAQTGESIKFGFDSERKFIPRFRFSDNDLEVLVPHWTAGVVLTAIALGWGLNQYKTVLEVKKLNLEIEKIEQEANENYDLKRFDDPSDQLKLDLDNNLQYFHQEINMPNIREVQINGSRVRSDTNRTEE